MINRKKRYLRQLVTISALTLLGAGAAFAGPMGVPGGFGMNPGWDQGPGPADASGFPGMGSRWGDGSGSQGGPYGPGPNFRDFAGPQLYGAFSADTTGDPFVNPGRFSQASGLPFVDENRDGICDYFQDTALYREELGLEWVDANLDGISDLFQTRQRYLAMGMDNFVDVDSDGLCDNYELFPLGPSGPGNFRGTVGPQVYHPFEVDTAYDPFVSPELFMQRTGLGFVDENGDGICDYVQDGPHFRELGIGAWTDANEDGIADQFQSREMYWALGMHNFVDVDGDGLCDNYEQDPFAAGEVNP